MIARLLARGLHTASRRLAWKAPAGRDTGIVVRNSLVRDVVPLVLPAGNTLTWYQCGPTVYSMAHIGHAATYVRFDLIRRILQRHFRIDVRQVMGITDVDDKIIMRARERRISIMELAREFESEFCAQMSQLNVLPPQTLVRVSEHMDEIIDFIQMIEHKYTTPDGSVCFDTAAFGPAYGKLQPERQTDATSVTDAEALSGKKRPADFVLWKARTQEPYWPSPFGNGRPGWHIECSTMASKMFGAHLDLHTGGIDLAFPHHENEMAQSESKHSVEQWGNYYLHSGHITLADVKMSKSLGNVINIGDLLASYTPAQFRLFCMQSKYHQSVNFSTELMENAINVEQRLQQFIQLCSAACAADPTTAYKWTDREFALNEALAATRTKVDQAYRNDFNVPVALAAVLDLVSAGFAYINAPTPPVPQAVATVLTFVTEMLETLGLPMAAAASPMAGWGGKVARSQHAPGADTKQQGLAAHVSELVDFRGRVRQQAVALLSTDQAAAGKGLLRACDEVRDRLKSCVPPVELQDTKQQSLWRVAVAPAKKQ